MKRECAGLCREPCHDERGNDAERALILRSCAGCENLILTERRRFNEAAMVYNQSVRRFPSNIIANLFGFEKRPYFEADAGAENAPKTF